MNPSRHAFPTFAACVLSDLPTAGEHQQQQTYQPVFVIPITAASLPPDPAVDLSNHKRPLSHPPTGAAVKNAASTPPSSEVKRGKRPPHALDDRETRRRVRKQNMERRRRACISDKLSTLHSLVVSLVGEKPQRRSRERTEITDILNQCTKVLQGLADFVKNEPELRAKLHRLRPSAAENLPPAQRRRQQDGISASKGGAEKEKENVSPRPSAFTPVGTLRPLMPTTSAGVAHQQFSPSRRPPTARGRRRESVDSGLSADCLSSPSTTTGATLRVPSPVPASSSSSSTSTSRAGAPKPPTWRLKSPLTYIWRPYRD